MRAGTRLRTFLVAILLLFGLAAASVGQQTQGSMFKEATGAFEAARAVQADLFAPKTYAKAIKHYRNAERRYTEGQSAEAIRRDLAVATEYFGKAVEASKDAQAEFAPALKARADAEKVDAAAHANAMWRRAEQKLSRAISDLERAAVYNGKQKAAEAEQMYRDAELATIKNTLLNEARLSLAQAERDRVGRYAPRTLQKAKDLLAQAASALDENRYDSDRPRNLAQQAQSEVKHAMYLAEVVKKAKAEKLTPEDLILEGEKPVTQIAAAADMKASFDSGYEAPTKKIIGYIEEQQDRLQRLEQDKNDLKKEVGELQGALNNAAKERTALSKRLDVQIERRKQLEEIITGLQSDVETLQRNLGGVAEERFTLSDDLDRQTRLRESLEQEVVTLKREVDVLEKMLSNVSAQRELLSKRLDAQTRVRERFEQVEQMFTRQEARVLRQFDDVVIRLVGLSFPSGQSTLNATSFGLLGKVGKAVLVFPGSKLTIEGHTDSFGSDAANLVLSQKRAEAVKKYLVSNGHLDASQIEAVGYGETRPVANNETKEGRAKNRRIDVVIRPKAGP